MGAVTTAVIAAAGVASSAYSASRQRSAARNASRQQQQAMDRQAEADQARLEFAREQYQDWRDMFLPVAEDLRSMAYEERDPNYDAITADVGSAFDTSQAINRRQQQRFGYRPEDGAVHQSELQYGLGRAQAMVNARNQARNQAEDQRFNRMMAFYGMGNGQGQAAANLVSAAHAGISGNAANSAAMFGRDAMSHQSGMNQSLNNMMQWAGYGMSQFGRGGSGSGGAGGGG